MKTQDAESLERLSEILNIEDFRGIKKTDLTFTKAKSPEGKTFSLTFRGFRVKITCY